MLLYIVVSEQKVLFHNYLIFYLKKYPIGQWGLLYRLNWPRTPDYSVTFEVHYRQYPLYPAAPRLKSLILKCFLGQPRLHN